MLTLASLLGCDDAVKKVEKSRVIVATGSVDARETICAADLLHVGVRRSKSLGIGTMSPEHAVLVSLATLL